MFKKYLIIFVVLFLALGLIIFVYFNRKPFEKTAEENTPIQTTEKISEKSENSPYYEVIFEYPQFSNLSNDINNDIKENSLKIIKEFKENLLETCSEKESGCNLVNSFDVFRNNKIISLNFNYYAFTGGAHGITSNVFLNYRVSDGKKIALEDIFKTSAPYLNRISDYCIKSLKERLLASDVSDENWIEQGAAPNRENYSSNIGFSEYGLVVIFSQYQVAPFAAGEQVVMISYDEIKDLIKEDYLAE